MHALPRAWARALQIGAALLALACVVGCRDKAANRVAPANGVNTQAVEYHAPNPLSHVVVVPNAPLSGAASTPISLDPQPRLRRGAPMTFEGTLDAGGAPSALVLVSFSKSSPTEKKTLTNEFSGVATASDDQTTLSYSLVGSAPLTTGANLIEISVVRSVPPTDETSEDLPSPTTTVIATGAIEIE